MTANLQTKMVDVVGKRNTVREAVATGCVQVGSETARMIARGEIPKGDVLNTARVAGITGAKRTPEIVPLCHPLLISSVGVDIHVDESEGRVLISATVRCLGKTGVETTQDEFDEIVLLNMRGPFNMIRAVAPAMIAQGAGRIVNVGGTFGMRGKAGRLAYSSSKWGLRGITKSFALELGPHGIAVNTVAPGMVDGPRFRTKVAPEMARRFGISEDEAVKRHASDYALRRISTDRDVADACVFLASARARQITGADLPVDGGWAAL